MRDEGRLDETVRQSAAILSQADVPGLVPSTINDSEATPAQDILGKSLSSQFFSKLRKSVDSAVVIGKEHSIMREQVYLLYYSL